MSIGLAAGYAGWTAAQSRTLCARCREGRKIKALDSRPVLCVPGEAGTLSGSGGFDKHCTPLNLQSSSIDPTPISSRREALQSEGSVLCTLAKLDPEAFSVAAAPPPQQGRGQQISVVCAEGVEVVLPLAGAQHASLSQLHSLAAFIGMRSTSSQKRLLSETSWTKHACRCLGMMECFQLATRSTAFPWVFRTRPFFDFAPLYLRYQSLCPADVKRKPCL